MVGNNVIDHTEEQIMEGLVIQCKDLKKLEASRRICTGK